jgi:hypothetical protein
MRALRIACIICFLAALIRFTYTNRVNAQSSTCPTPTPTSGQKWGGAKSISVYIDPSLSTVLSNGYDAMQNGLQSSVANWNALNFVGARCLAFRALRTVHHEKL